MKKYFIFFLGCLLSLFSFAQWTTSGTNIYNSNSGNVGIGITNPLEKLHMAGNIKFGSSSGGFNSPNNIEWYTSNYQNGFGHKIYNMDGTGKTDLRIAGRHNSATWVDIVTFTSAGNIGIGSTLPGFKLDVNATGRFRGPSGINANIILQGGVVDGGGTAYQAFWLTGANGILKIGGNGGSEPSAGAINIDYLGNVSIGTTNGFGYKLAVNGSAIFTEAKVKLNANWPDYVFHNNYKLLPLNELEKFIHQNNHLPNIPSASEIKKNDGFELGDMNIRLLEKIEELTLYVIELKKENDQLRKEFQGLVRLRD